MQEKRAGEATNFVCFFIFLKEKTNFGFIAPTIIGRKTKHEEDQHGRIDKSQKGMHE